ncbi:histidine ammonia-lyase [Microbulbifer thermotolerans]|uniref:Histidine ammonia-lyase n=1 Tax=Microbulbifer thermotolerans TaxID=252514 RepID=A0A143HQA0_MICTH|nr:histidine ammonia-lyase [Microbulbifer thermotolerans]AMX03681.1 histidine ammonia-lyase [Microbulbifer thermotolerans]MCX2780953.1 histidine ammonia-lyase [Microbulbifer thermotolerans]MCX2782062.1 histidine ammonia-lyase [Microbulbifer thermotolerans]MCX2796193.1 histidine ammonia-lyase [Microbulbifer thermotolerans]MCX2802533.1 histidine ammonia-lyase [Microbulbifer thermotolerans]
MYQLEIDPGQLSLAQLRRVAREPVTLSLAKSAYPAIEAAAKTVAQVLSEGRTVYGINTGFGLLANTRIEKKDLETLQRAIVLSHAAGTGDFMDEATVRLLMVLKINSLARGFSGVRAELIDALIQLVNAGVIPAIPEKGSVGASGDLAPLAHMSVVLLGEGEVFINGERRPAIDGLKKAGLTPITLAPKEGLALLNGTQASTAFALQGLFAAEDLFAGAVVTGALALEAAKGSRRPFDDRIHQVRGQKAQRDVAAAYRALLGDSSQIGDSHQFCEKVQDPYSLRCQPQVMGACLQQIRFAAEVLLAEANGVSDNPLVFADGEDTDIISGGNFHAEPVAMVADNLALALAEIGALSERRMALLIDTNLSGLPPFLVENGGVNSGFMIAQVTAAALASENKTLAHPASVDSLPTSANQEDHVSMATFAGRRLRDMADNTCGILAVELLAACQGLDFRAPLKTTETLEAAKAMLRERVAFYDKDRYFAPDIEEAKQLLKSALYLQLVNNELLPSCH